MATSYFTSTSKMSRMSRTTRVSLSMYSVSSNGDSGSRSTFARMWSICAMRTSSKGELAGARSVNSTDGNPGECCCSDRAEWTASAT